MNDEKFFEEIIPEIKEYLIQNGRGIIITQGYEWFREVITLYAKQNKLLEAALKLIENGMNEEALIIARSAMNNYFLIGYLLNDDDKRTRLKEYQIQPLLSKIYLLKNMNKMIKGDFGKRMKETNVKLGIELKEIKQRKWELEKELEDSGYSKDKRMLSISKVADKCDESGFELYSMYYTKASSYEHSDISSLEIYKKQVDENIPNNQAFIMDLNRTDEELKNDIFGIFSICYLDSFIKIADVVVNKEPQLRGNYDIPKLTELILKALAYLKNKEVNK